MKLATLNDGTRDGELLVVSRNLERAVPAGTIARTLQAALDNWRNAQPALADLAQRLDSGQAAGSLPFHPKSVMAPLPRAYHWVDGSAYVNHVELVRRARGAEMPASFWEDPLVYQGGSDDFLAPIADAPFVSEEHGIDFEGEIAIVTDDVPMGVSPEAARNHIKLIMLVNDWSLRNLIPGELAKGFGFYQSKPATAFSPVCVTPDELGEAWDGGRIHLPLVSHVNGQLFGRPNAGIDMTFDFPRLVSHIARTRRARAGTIVGSGTVSNKLEGGPGKRVPDGGDGYSCIAEQRTIETIEQGKPATTFLKFGDTVRIEMLDAEGRSIFGAIDQRVVKAG
jgi:fumarylacetoacetate (FAA) hydrolase